MSTKKDTIKELINHYPAELQKIVTYWIKFIINKHFEESPIEILKNNWEDFEQTYLKNKPYCKTADGHFLYKDDIGYGIRACDFYMTDQEISMENIVFEYKAHEIKYYRDFSKKSLKYKNHKQWLVFKDKNLAIDCYMNWHKQYKNKK